MCTQSVTLRYGMCRSEPGSVRHQPATRTFAIDGVAQRNAIHRALRARLLIPSGGARHCGARRARPAAVAQLRDVAQILHGFVPAPAEAIRMIRTARAVPDMILEASAAAAENDASMHATTGLAPVNTRLVITRNLRFEPLAAAAEALARDVRYNMFRERRDVVQQALQLYNLARGYTRNARAASLAAHVETMQSALGRTGRPRKRKPVPPPSPKQK